MKIKSSVKEILTVNLVIFMTIALLYMFTLDNKITTVLSPSNGAIYQGNSDKPNVSLMFNVYWGTEYIDGILETLKKEDVHATFFVGGMWAKNNTDILKRLKEEGHEIGNHGHMHKKHSQLDSEKNAYEITQCQKIVEDATGIRTNLFAPPSGDFDVETVKGASDLGYRTIMWTADTIDWRDKNTEIITQRAVKGAENGALILMHPTKNTLEALPEIIKQIKSKGFNITTVSQTLETD